MKGLKIVINSLSAASLIGIDNCETFPVLSTAVEKIFWAAVISRRNFEETEAASSSSGKLKVLFIRSS